MTSYDMIGNLDRVFQMIGIVFFLTTFAIALVLYVLQAIGLKAVAESEGYHMPNLAWVPVLNLFMPFFLNEENVVDVLKNCFAVTYGVTLGIGFILGVFIPFLLLPPAGLMFYAFYLIMDRYSKNVVGHLIAAFLTCGVSMPISYFLIRHHTLIDW